MLLVAMFLEIRSLYLHSEVGKNLPDLTKLKYSFTVSTLKSQYYKPISSCTLHKAIPEKFLELHSTTVQKILDQRKSFFTSSRLTAKGTWIQSDLKFHESLTNVESIVWLKC